MFKILIITLGIAEQNYAIMDSDGLEFYGVRVDELLAVKKEDFFHIWYISF